MVEEQNAVNVSRESETPLYSELSSVTSSHYQGLQHMNACYENSDVAQMKKKNELEAYEEIGQVRRFIRYVRLFQLPSVLIWIPLMWSALVLVSLVIFWGWLEN